MSAPLRATFATFGERSKFVPKAAVPALPWGLWLTTSTVWWGAQFLVTALLDRGTANGMPAQLLRANATSAVLWVGLTVFIFWLAERAPIDRYSWRWSAPLAVAAAGAVVLVRAIAVALLNPLIGWYADLPPFSTVLLTSFGNNFFLFWLVLGAGHGLAYARRVRERDEQLALAELQHLKAQLHPHFLFNTLNTISTFVRTDPEAAVQMIAQLATLLRHALQHAGAQEVVLEEELAIVAVYLEIERQRFDERLQVVWRIDPSVMRARVPHLLLQPLVENAIRHGIAPMREGGTIKIQATRDSGTVRIVVEDNGISDRVPPPEALGIGLGNTQRRLEQLYRGEQLFEISVVKPHGLRLSIDLPYREQSRAAAEHSSVPVYV